MRKKGRTERQASSTLKHSGTTWRDIVERVRKGEDFTVFHRSHPVFRIVPVPGAVEFGNIEDDPLYKAEAVGRSKDGLTAADHDRILYGESQAGFESLPVQQGRRL